jgi:hypothetical protein
LVTILIKLDSFFFASGRLGVWALIVASVVSALPVSAKEIRVDYFGHPVRLECAVEAAEFPAATFLELVKKDEAETASCIQPMARAASSLGLDGYAQALFFERLVAGLPGSRSETGSNTSFAEAVRDGKPLARRDRIALLYALLSRAGFGVGVMRGDEYYFLVLRIDEEISGRRWARQDRFTWEPGRPFTDVGPAADFHRAHPVVYHDGRPVDFPFPDLDWKAGGGKAKSLTSPPGCPKSWDRSLSRRPGLEHYLSLWPRDQAVQSANSHLILAEYGLDRTMSDRAGLADEALGNCILQYAIGNFPYDWERAKDPDSDPTVRHPGETLFRGGDCDELTYVLLGLLRLAGFDPSRIVVLRWDPGQADTHMNLGVEPLSGTLEFGSWVESRGRRFYIMDPSYMYTYNNKLATVWGMLSKKYQGKRTEIYPVK